MSKLLKGSQIKLYNNDYTVMSSTDSYTLLKDQLGNPVAYPTSKLKTILNTLNKSEEGSAPSAGSGQAPGKLHAGKIRVDKVDSKGHKYYYWVNATSGVRHDEHDSQHPSDNQIDEASNKLHSDVLSMINTKTAPEDRHKLKMLLNDWVISKAAHHNLKEAHTQLRKESKGGVPTSTLNNLSDKQSEHEAKYEALKSALVASAIKFKKGAE